jgi:hypothetical protein
MTGALTVNGNITATTNVSAGSFTEGGVALSSKYITSASLDTTYLRLNGANTMTGDLSFNKTNLDIKLTPTNGNNIAIPSTAGFFSTSAIANDLVIRSLQSLILQNGGGDYGLKIGTNNFTYINKQFYVDCVPADNKATVEARIIATYPTMATIFGGDLTTNAYWGYAININSGGWANGYGGANNTQSYIPGYSAFTVNMRTTDSATSFDKNLFTVRPSGFVGINTNNPNCHLTVAGLANIHNGSPYAVANNYMQSGSLTIGGVNANYGGGANWNTNTAGLMMECQTETEIAIHDAGQRIASFMRFVRDGVNQFCIGRDMGWGEISQTNFYGNVSIGNVLFLKVGVWHRSSDNQQRLYFDNNGTTFIQGQGIYPIVFRNNANADIVVIDSNGKITGKTINVSGFDGITLRIDGANNYWNIYTGTSPTTLKTNSLIFFHGASGISSNWWLDGTQTNTNADISDKRSKYNIEDFTALETIEKLKPKSFDVIDDKDVKFQYGFVAQDIEEIPELKKLVFTEPDYIANVNTYGKRTNKDGCCIITANDDLTDKIAVGDELKFVSDNNDKGNQEYFLDATPYHKRYKRRYAKVTEIISPTEFKVDCHINKLCCNNDDEFLIYGKKVEDAKSLDYNSVIALNTKAIQELYEIINKIVIWMKRWGSPPIGKH